ncbi:hypothetical protein GWN42_17475 [candidate division KSB1 bacterium]|nr:hypothetical protein [candidate division KSB1 bacterium]
MKSKPRQTWWIWIVYVLLFGFSIPWYLPKNRPPKIWFGFPHWVLISLLCTVGIAFFTVFVIFKYWDSESSRESKSER